MGARRPVSLMLEFAVTMDDATPRPANPWRTMWLSPRLTIRELLATENRPTWVPVVAMAAVSYACMSVQIEPDGSFSSARSAMPVTLAVLQAVGGVVVGPFILAIVGGWFGSDADPSDIRQAVVWADVPVAVTAVLWIPVLLGLGGKIFAADELPMDSGRQWMGGLAFIGIAICYFWSIVLLIAGVAEAQRLSIPKALLTLAIPLLPLLILRLA